MELYDVLLQVGFATSKTELDVKKFVFELPYDSLNDLKVDFRKCKKNVKFGLRNSLVPIVPYGNKNLAISVKANAKDHIKVF